MLLKYWTNVGFSHIASFLGVPLYADDLTLQASRIYFARIFVVIDVEGIFLEKIKVKPEFGRGFEVRVEYS